MSSLIFPSALILLDFCAAAVYGWEGNLRLAIYWAAAGVLTICVTF